MREYSASRRPRLGLVVRAPVLAYVATTLCALGLGYVVSLSDTFTRADVGESMLIGSGLVATLALRSNDGRGFRNAGPGLWLAALALAGAFLFGLLAGNGLENHRGDIALAFGLAVASVIAGGLMVTLLAGARPGDASVPRAFDVLSDHAFLGVCVVSFGVAMLNLVTGDVPLFSSDIDNTRLTGGAGVVGQVWVWVLGSLEWILIITALAAVAHGRMSRRALIVVAVAAIILFLLAGRSFFVIPGLAILVAIAASRGVHLGRVVVIGLVGLLLLGAAGAFRQAHSAGGRGMIPTSGGIGNATLSTISRSASIGPAVFASALDEIPTAVPYQDGIFLMRDFRAVLPLHPLGRPQRSDTWVTSTLRGRNVALVGGSPPTLAGGFYIDFGFPGIAIGCLCLGAVLTLTYNWWRRVRTIGALALYGYLASYVALGSYSYMSIKPTVVAVIALSLTLHAVEMRSRCRTRGGCSAR